MKNKIILFLSLLIILSNLACHKPNPEELIIAVSNRSVKEVEELIKKNVPLEPVDIGINALKIAASNNDQKIIELLIGYGVSPNIVLDDGDSLLLWAVRKKSLSLIDVLIRKGADVNFINQENKSPVFSYAINFLPEESLDLFIDNGLDVLEKDEKGKTYFEELLIREKTSTAMHLLSYPEVLNSAVNDKYIGLELIYYWTKGTKEIADTLVSNGLKLNTEQPLLQEAIRSLNYEAVDWLLNQGVSLTSKYIDPSGFDVLNEGTPLDIVFDTEYRLLHYAGKDYKSEEGDFEVIEIRRIRKLIEESIEQNNSK